jgi:hypothetical protein
LIPIAPSLAGLACRVVILLVFMGICARIVRANRTAGPQTR